MKRIIIFVDYENVTKIQLKNHLELECVLYVFIGSQQKSVPTATLVNISSYSTDPTFIQVSGTTKDNLDFHLCAELGIVHTQEPLSTEFIILSKDKGFDSLVKYFRTTKHRPIRRLASLSSLFPSKKTVKKPASSPIQESSPKRVPPRSTTIIEDMAVTYRHRLLSMKSTIRPRKIETLKNDMRSFFKKEALSVTDLERIYNVLLNTPLFTVESQSQSITYTTQDVSVKMEEMTIAYREHLLAVKSTKRPRKAKTLKNDISSFFKKDKISSAQIEQLYQLLLKKKLFTVDSSTQRITYTKVSAKKTKNISQKSPHIQSVPKTVQEATETVAERATLLLPDPIEDMTILYSKHLLACQNGQLPHNVKLLKDDIVHFFQDKHLSPTDREGIYRRLIKKGIFNIDGTTNTLTYPWSN